MRTCKAKVPNFQGPFSLTGNQMYAVNLTGNQMYAVRQEEIPAGRDSKVMM